MHLNIFLKFKPSHLEALSKLGTVYLRIGKFPDATSVFEKILKTKPDNIDALEGLADVYAKRGSIGKLFLPILIL